VRPLGEGRGGEEEAVVKFKRYLSEWGGAEPDKRKVLEKAFLWPANRFFANLANKDKATQEYFLELAPDTKDEDVLMFLVGEWTTGNIVATVVFDVEYFWSGDEDYEGRQYSWLIVQFTENKRRTKVADRRFSPVHKELVKIVIREEVELGLGDHTRDTTRFCEKVAKAVIPLIKKI
jgi:hypothetical protein